jgi:hypothetical protein
VVVKKASEYRSQSGAPSVFPPKAIVRLPDVIRTGFALAIIFKLASNYGFPHPRPEISQIIQLAKK